MTVQELVDICKNRTNISIKNLVNVKEYLPLQEKIQLIDNILSKTRVVSENGFISYDEIKKYIYLTMYILSTYTDITCSDNYQNMLKEYDILYTSGMLSKVMSLLETEYESILSFMAMRYDESLKTNSIEYCMKDMVKMKRCD